MSKVGRPLEWTEEKQAEAKELYIALLAEGKTEKEINAVDGVPAWNMRWKWKQDPEFKIRCQRAEEYGVEIDLSEYEQKLESMLVDVMDGSAPPHAVSLLSEMGRHRRWKAGKKANERYGDKVNVGGQEDNPLVVTVKAIQISHVKSGRDAED